MTETEINAILRVMADDAFVVMNWARKQGFKRDEQINQVVSAYRKTLTDAKAKIGTAE